MWDEYLCATGKEDDSGVFIGGTRERIIQHILGLDAPSPPSLSAIPSSSTDVGAFLYGYGLVFTSHELLDHLISLYSMEDAMLSLEHISMPAMRIFLLGLSRARSAILDFLLAWVSSRPEVFLPPPPPSSNLPPKDVSHLPPAHRHSVVERALDFVSQAMALQPTKPSPSSSSSSSNVHRGGGNKSKLEELARKLVLPLRGVASHPTSTQIPYLSASGVAPPSTETTSLGSESLKLCSPAMLGEQITLLQHRAFMRIVPEDLFGLGGEPSSEELLRVSPGLATSLALSETLSMWVLNAILQEKNKSKRVALREFFLEAAVTCLSLDNVCGARDLMMALDHSLISNLKEHESDFRGKDGEFYTSHIEMFLDARHIKVQTLMESAGRPMVPVVVAFKYWAVQADMKTPLVMNAHNSLDPNAPAASTGSAGEEWFSMDKIRILGKNAASLASYQSGEYYVDPAPAVVDFLAALPARLWPIKTLEKRADTIDPMDPALAAALGLA